MTNKTDPTRRRILAGLAGAGTLAGVGLLSGVASGGPGYDRYTYVQAGDDAGVRVAWYTTYNGAFAGAQSGSQGADATAVLDPDVAPVYVPDATGPVVELNGVLPGDAGTVAVGLLPDRAPARVWLRPVVSATPENGRVEPERTAGDDDAVGELQDRLRVALWVDDGVAGVGACDGSLDGMLGESPVTDRAVTPTVLADRLTGGLVVADCLPDGAARCVGLRWTFPGGPGANVVQTDGITLELGVAATPCDDDCNPFTGEGCDDG
jgi:hypothetical protein